MSDTEAGWHVILRNADGAIACLHFDGTRWQRLNHNSASLPRGWRLGPRVDELLEFAEANADPREVSDG